MYESTPGLQSKLNISPMEWLYTTGDAHSDINGCITSDLSIFFNFFARELAFSAAGPVWFLPSRQYIPSQVDPMFRRGYFSQAAVPDLGVF